MLCFSGNYILEQSYVPCENLIDGRLSFQGMNIEIERLMQLEEIAKRPPVDRSMKTDVSDMEMTTQFKQSLVETVASKYQIKRNRAPNEYSAQHLQSTDKSPNKDERPPRKRARFLKPNYD